MTLVDFIDLDHDEWYVKVDLIDLSSDEDSVKKDPIVVDREEEDDNVPQSENLAEAATSLPISEQDATATTSLSMIDHGSTMSSLMEDKFMQPEKQEFLATNDGAKEGTQPGNHEFIAAADCMGEARQSESEAGVFSSMTEQAAATSLLLTKQGAITSSLKEDKSMQSGNQVFVAAVYCAKEAIQSENTAKAIGSPSMTERGATCKSHRVGQLCQMIGCPHIVGDGLDLCISHGGGHPHGEPVQETSRFRKFYIRKRKKQVSTSDTGCNRPLGIVQTKGVPPTLHNGDSGFTVMGNIRNGTASIGINVLDGEVLVSTYQGCSKTSQGNTTYGRVRDNGSKCCMVEGCTNGAHGSTPLCISHNSRPRKRCCAVIGCTKEARKSCQGLTQRCVKHGGGKRCKYDGCGKGAKGDYCIAHGGGRRCKFQGCRKGTQGQTDYCIEQGGGRRCRFLGCSVSATHGKNFCSMHKTNLLSDNNSTHEILPAPAPVAEPSKGRNSCSVIGGMAQKRQNTNDHVNTGSFNIIETAEENGRVFVCQNNMLKTHRVRDNGSKCCMVEGCTNGAHGSTPLCISHNSRPRKRCCAVIGCTKEARTSCQGLTQRCMKHGGGKRCKYDGCGKGAIKGNYCIAHGGGRRCKFQGCRKGTQGQTDYCIEHGGGRRCRFLGCSVSATYGKNFCSMHKTNLLKDNNSAHEILPAPASEAEPSKGKNSCSVIGGMAQKRQNTNDHVNTGSFNIIETAEDKGRVFVCHNNMLKTQVRDNGSKCCMVEGCTNVAHGSTPLCISHNSRPRKRCCAVIGCTKEARTSCQGLTQRCVKHGGGKRCKYDGCGKGAKGDYCIAHGGGRRCKFQGCRKGAHGQTDYCMEHGGGRCCRFLECSAGATYGNEFCSMHRTSLLSGNNSAHEILPASKGRNSCSVIGGMAQKRQNTNDHVNTRSFDVTEMAEEKGSVFVCQNNVLTAQQTTQRLNFESGLAAGSPSLQLASTSPTTVARF